MIPRLPAGFSHPMRIGEGAFASVFRVRQAALDRWVALKFIYEKDRARRHAVLGEARTQAKLRADCVPQIYDAFEWRNSVCIVMEWIRGVSLTALLNASLPTNDRCALAGGLVRVLAAIHGQGFAHRDLKPENVIISPDRGLFLVDFGFSKNIADKQVSSVTAAKGTPAYMAPELWSRGTQVDLMRADIYAAGKVLLQVLSETPHSFHTAPLMHENPQLRPASGRELLEQWERKGVFPQGDPDWTRMAGNLTAELLSDNLLAAAQQLLYAHRSEEAYWLLVESLEENGNNRQTIALMNGFQERTDRKRSVLQYMLFAAILLTGVLAAFFAGARSGKTIELRPAPIARQRTPRLLPTLIGRVPQAALALREDTLPEDKLSGRLLVRNLPHGATLRVNARDVSADSATGSGLYLHQGEHAVTVRDSMGRIIRHEKIRLLPFQTKTVDGVRHFSSSGDQ
ncbi:MAG: serine/threonine protein kinase [Chitinispirillaceae bacterium]|nr:serine/threonine protein kinase [Chitinispirillaceae bacterium]